MAELLEYLDIVDRQSWRAWMLENHPDKGGNNDKFVLVKAAYDKVDTDPASTTTTTTTATTTPSTAATAFAFMNLFPKKRVSCYNRSWLCYCPTKATVKGMFCEKHSISNCHRLVDDKITRGKKQCGGHRRKDDIYCSLHSDKPTIVKVKATVVQCSHIKSDGIQCKVKSQTPLCFRHRTKASAPASTLSPEI